MKLCPHCNAELKDDASFCRHCGSDMNTGWKEGAAFSFEELPDYEEILENEFGDDPRSPYAKKNKGFGGIAGTIAAIIVAMAFVAAMVMH
ncbi:MAG: zinc-ribbon domain-containing protein [Fibrobacter sp.]|nr:zinc-ribbon domain-containing protein [Fibrobacter sp.]